jgi:hypothetical protein
VKGQLGLDPALGENFQLPKFSKILDTFGTALSYIRKEKEAAPNIRR